MHFTNFAGNDYLGLARDVRLAEAADRAAREYGISTTSSRWGLGWTDLHERLEVELAEFFTVDAVGTLGAAFLGGLAYFTAMAGRCDVVYCDEQSHTNLLLGIKAAGLDTRAYRHLDADDLRRQLRGHRGRAPIVATDSIFSMSGELAPLPDIADAAGRIEAELLVDDAHGVFALGDGGRGALEACGVSPARCTLLGSMSKALGCGGGFLAGRREVIDAVRRGDTVSGSSVLPAPVAGACVEALRIVRREPQRREQLLRHARRMRDVLAEHSQTVVSDQTQIVAMQMADAEQAARFSERFLKFGLRVPYFHYPAEPRQNLLRSVARSCYTPDDLQRFAAAIGS